MMLRLHIHAAATTYAIDALQLITQGRRTPAAIDTKSIGFAIILYYASLRHVTIRDE